MSYIFAAINCIVYDANNRIHIPICCVTPSRLTGIHESPDPNACQSIKNLPLKFADMGTLGLMILATAVFSIGGRELRSGILA